MACLDQLDGSENPLNGPNMTFQTYDTPKFKTHDRPLIIFYPEVYSAWSRPICDGRLPGITTPSLTM